MKTTIKLAIIAICFGAVTSAYADQTQNGGSVFLAQDSEKYLNAQLKDCSDLAAAGSTRGANICATRTSNAYNFLASKASNSKLPAPVWRACVNSWKTDMELGARCVAAAEDICKLDETGKITDYNSCIQVMGTGKWVTNQSAAELKFDGNVKVSNAN